MRKPDEIFPQQDSGGPGPFLLFVIIAAVVGVGYFGYGPSQLKSTVASWWPEGILDSMFSKNTVKGANGEERGADRSQPTTSKQREASAPDRRFIDAIEDVGFIVTGATGPEPAVSSRGGRWDVTFDGTSLGTVEAETGYEALRSLVVARVDSLEASNPDAFTEIDAPNVSKALKDFHPRHLFAALWELDDAHRRAGGLSPELLVPAARASVLLYAQMHDATDIGDPVAARAIALVSLARERSGAKHDNLRDVEALLAQTLGYHDAARTLAGRLPDDHPVRLYVFDEQQKLRDAARGLLGSNLAIYLHLSAAPDFETWQKTLRMRFDGEIPSTPVMATGALRVQPHSARPMWQERLQEMVVDFGDGRLDVHPNLDTLKERESSKTEAIRKVISGEHGLRVKPDALETALAERSGDLDGRILDSRLFATFYRAMYYTAVYRIAVVHHAKDLEAPHRARAVADALPETGPQPAPDVRRRIHDAL